MSSGRSGAFGAVVAQAEALEPQQPGDGALDDPAVSAELGLVLDPAAGDPDLDPAPVQVPPAAGVVVALVGVQLLGPASGPAGVGGGGRGRRGWCPAAARTACCRGCWPPRAGRAAEARWRRQSRWYLEPGLPRSVGFGPVSSPPFSPAPTPRRCWLGTSRAARRRRARRARAGAAGPTPRRPARRAADARRCARTAAELRGQVAPAAAGVEHEQDALERGAVGDRRPPTRAAQLVAAAGSAARAAPTTDHRPTAAASSSPRPRRSTINLARSRNDTPGF